MDEEPDLTFRLVFPATVTCASVQTRMTLLEAVVFTWLHQAEERLELRRRAVRQPCLPVINRCFTWPRTSHPAQHQGRASNANLKFPEAVLYLSLLGLIV